MYKIPPGGGGGSIASSRPMTTKIVEIPIKQNLVELS